MQAATERNPAGQSPTVYLSYNSKERDKVVAIAERLRQDGVEVWLDLWRLKPGDRWQDLVEEAHHSATWVIFLGPKGLGLYHQLELALATSRGKESGRGGVLAEFYVIPGLLPGLGKELRLNLPPLFQELMRVEFGRLDDEVAYGRLLASIRERMAGKPAPRDRPPSQDVFLPAAIAKDPARLVEVLARLAFQDRSRLRLCEAPDAAAVREALRAAQADKAGFEDNLRSATAPFDPNALWKAWMVQVHGERLRQISEDLLKAAPLPEVPPEQTPASNSVREERPKSSRPPEVSKSVKRAPNAPGIIPFPGTNKPPRKAMK